MTTAAPSSSLELLEVLNTGILPISRNIGGAPPVPAPFFCTKNRTLTLFISIHHERVDHKLQIKYCWTWAL